jgi:hypothetical protein
MAKLSVLIFSRNDVGKTIDLISDLYQIADDIVLMDSSDKRERNELHTAKQDQRMAKLQIFYVVPLAPLEALRAYAFKKCKYSWVLLIDTDERLNESLKSDLKDIITNAKCNAFAIKRYEDVAERKRTSFYTWQIRLFRKEHVEFKGLLHEQALVSGITEKLGGEYAMDHIVELKTKGYGWEYSKILKYDRLSYELYNKRVIDYVSKLLMPKNRSVENTALGKSIRSFMLAYEKITLKEQGQELSNLDYFVYYSVLDLGYAIKRRSVAAVLQLIPFERARLKRINEWKSEPDADEIFEISKMINRMGVVKFLDLDKEATIRGLNRKYADRKKSGELMMELIKEKYEKQNKKMK